MIARVNGIRVFLGIGLVDDVLALSSALVAIFRDFVFGFPHPGNHPVADFAHVAIYVIVQVRCIFSEP